MWHIIVINILATQAGWLHYRNENVGLTGQLTILVANMRCGISNMLMYLIYFVHVAPNQYTKKAENVKYFWNSFECKEDYRILYYSWGCEDIQL